MTKSAPVALETALAISAPDSSDSNGNPQPAPHAGSRRVVELAGVAAGVAALMLVMEVVKQWWHPDITVWESHSITIVVSSLSAVLAGYVVLRSNDRLNARLVSEYDRRVRVAEEVSRANALLQATLESNRDGVLVAGLDGTIVTFNRRVLDMWHVQESVLQGPPAEFRRLATEQLLNPGVLSASVARLRSGVASESADVLEFKDGRTMELLASPQLLDGVVVGRVWRSRDITAHRLAQQHIQMLAQTIRSIAECVSVTDMEDRILFVNQAFLDTYHFEESELLGRHIDVLRPYKSTEAVTRQVLAATREGGWQGELWNRRKDGTDFEIFLSTSIVRDEGGAPVALVGVARDITEQRRTEAALARGRDSERIVTLAAGIAHEFNNLLQTVLASTALALEDLPPDSGARDPLHLILHASERASNLTAQLLAYAGRGVFVRMVPFDLNDEIRGQSAFVRALMPPDTTFELDLAAEGAPIRADRQQIRQVLTSLGTNAAEAMAKRHGRTIISTRVEDITTADDRPWIAGERPAAGRYVCLCVADQGVGMEAGTISRIFDPFFSTKFQGRGMGLPAVLGIARATGGAIAVDSVPGQGTSVTVAFPHHATGAGDSTTLPEM